MESIDAFVLKKYQSISDWFQDWFAKDNFFLARICLLAYAASQCAIDALAAIMEGREAIPVFGTVITLIISAILWFVIRNAEHSCKNNLVFKNKMVTAWAFIRPFILFFELVPILVGVLTILLFVLSASQGVHGSKSELYGNLLHSIRSLFYVCTIYFASCTPNPAKPSKARELINKLKSKMNEASTPATVPQVG